VKGDVKLSQPTNQPTWPGMKFSVAAAEAVFRITRNYETRADEDSRRRDVRGRKLMAVSLQHSCDIASLEPTGNTRPHCRRAAKNAWVVPAGGGNVPDVSPHSRRPTFICRNSSENFITVSPTSPADRQNEKNYFLLQRKFVCCVVRRPVNQPCDEFRF